MEKRKRQRLEADGWRVGTADEFLGLSKLESQFLDLKMALARGLRARRLDRQLTQAALAEMIGSSQSRVAKMEAGAPSVTVDLLVRTLLALGASIRDLGRMIESPYSAAA